jgi:predicted ABC-type ATPase
MKLPLDKRPIIVAIAGPNGAGKTTFCRSQLANAGLRIVNTDEIARVMGMDAYAAAAVAGAIRRQLVEARESFAFETVFSDPVGDKLGFLESAGASGYTVLLCFIGIGGPEVSVKRVAQRVAQGGHDVPGKKLAERYPRTLMNLKRAIRVLEHVWVLDNDDLRKPYRRVAVFEKGRRVYLSRNTPGWLARLMPPTAVRKGVRR